MQTFAEWIPKWKQNNWKNSSGHAISNVDLLKMIRQLCSEVRTKFILIDGTKEDKVKANKARELAWQGSEK